MCIESYQKNIRISVVGRYSLFIHKSRGQASRGGKYSCPCIKNSWGDPGKESDDEGCHSCFLAASRPPGNAEGIPTEPLPSGTEETEFISICSVNTNSLSSVLDPWALPDCQQITNSIQTSARADGQKPAWLPGAEGRVPRKTPPYSNIMPAWEGHHHQESLLFF